MCLFSANSIAASHAAADFNSMLHLELLVHMQEAKRFDGIDKAWKKIMLDTAKNPNVLEACSVDGRLDTLRMLSEQLETCQKSLSEYLDTKRCAFPRHVVRALTHQQ